MKTDELNFFQTVSISENDMRALYGGARATETEDANGGCCNDFVNDCEETTICDGTKSDDTPVPA